MAVQHKLVFLIVMITMILITSSQNTNHRGCECQYMLGGKCAYTLMIPVGKDGGAAASSCPSKSPQPSDLDTLQSDVKTLKSQVTDQSMTLNQLQRSILQQQEVIGNFNSSGSSSSDQCPATCQQLMTKQANQATIRDERFQELNTTVNAQQQTLETLSNKVEQVSNDVSEMKRLTNISAFLEQSKSLEEKVTQLKGTISDLKKSHRLCLNEGLLVSGKQHNISDSSMTASSVFDENHGANQSRLHTKTTLDSKLAGAWCPKEPRSNFEYIQYDLGKEMSVLGTATQGRYEYPQWVAWFIIQYATTAPDQDSSWQFYRNLGGSTVQLPGNWDQQNVQVNYLRYPIKARYVRIIPLIGGIHQNSRTNICLRADLIGCLDDL